MCFNLSICLAARILVWIGSAMRKRPTNALRHLPARVTKSSLPELFGFEGVGDGYLKLKQKDNAARAYQRALDLDPANSGAAQKLARARSN